MLMDCHATLAMTKVTDTFCNTVIETKEQTCPSSRETQRSNRHHEERSDVAIQGLRANVDGLPRFARNDEGYWPLSNTRHRDQGTNVSVIPRNPAK